MGDRIRGGQEQQMQLLEERIAQQDDELAQMDGLRPSEGRPGLFGFLFFRWI